ncbi:hypothetical protein [Candidatus Mycoplasma haematobovis]|nr:hypothetical protein [Candidatus Mycoplasma haematobovis]
MEKIIELFSKKEQMASLEQKSHWREELLYLLENKENPDEIIREMIDILNLLISQGSSDSLEKSLVEKFNLLVKYLNKPKEFWQRRILTLVDSSEEYLNDKSKISTLSNDYFFSQELSSWAEELYYLMRKLEKKSDVVEKTIELLKKARFALVKKDKLELDKNLRMFKLGKNRYIDISI